MRQRALSPSNNFLSFPFTVFVKINIYTYKSYMPIQTRIDYFLGNTYLKNLKILFCGRGLRMGRVRGCQCLVPTIGRSSTFSMAFIFITSLATTVIIFCICPSLPPVLNYEFINEQYVHYE